MGAADLEKLRCVAKEHITGTAVYAGGIWICEPAGLSFPATWYGTRLFVHEGGEHRHSLRVEHFIPEHAVGRIVPHGDYWMAAYKVTTGPFLADWKLQQSYTLDAKPHRFSAKGELLYVLARLPVDLHDYLVIHVTEAEKPSERRDERADHSRTKKS